MFNDIQFIYFQLLYTLPGPVFTKLFRIKIKIRLKFKILLLWTFLKPTINPH